MDINQVTPWTTLLSDAVTILAVLMGGYWAIYQHKIFRKAASNPQIDLNHELLDYGENYQLLVLNITIRNIGQVRVSAIKSGIKVSIKQLIGTKTYGDLLHWNDGEYLIENVDVIKEANPHMDDDVEIYRLEPGDEYHELLSVVVKKGILLMTRLEYKGQEGDHIWTYRVWRV